VAQVLDAGYDPLVVFPIFIAELSSPDFVFKNRLERTADFRAFYSFWLQMKANGLEVEQIKSPTPVVPPLTGAQAADPKLLAGLVSAASSSSGDASSGGLTLKEYDLKNNNDSNLSKQDKQELVREHADKYYRLVKSKSDYRFCFSKFTYKPYQFADFRKPKPVPAVIMIRIAENDFLKFPTASMVCGSKSTGQAGETLNIKTRSVEEIFQFLGKMARVELGLTGPPVPLEVPSNGMGNAISLFRVAKGIPTDQDIAATFDGETYFVRPDPTGEDASSSVIQLLSDLLALYNSAKSLPAPSVIPFVTTSP
jgi:hypothetical protein